MDFAVLLKIKHRRTVTPDMNCWNHRPKAFALFMTLALPQLEQNFIYNTLRKGSKHKVDAVFDRMSGVALKWEIVDGKHAQKNGHPRASEDSEYLKVHLARPVPEGGAARIRIDKTYRDTNSYYSKEGQIIFNRSLGIKRNSVVLPEGYELVSCNYPSQVQVEESSKIKVSFMNRGSQSVAYQLVAKPLPKTALEVSTKTDDPLWESYQQQPSGRDKSHARLEYNFSERAFQNRDIVYFPLQPETHSFRLYHDYTEFREGVDKYVNIVRKGSKATNPSAKILDTGEELKVETLQGETIREKGIEIRGGITPETEVVVIWFDPVKKGQSVRLRIEETYTDPNRYLLYNGELIWDRSFGRNRNTVILPEGWYLTTSSIPAIIDQTETGQPQLYFVNDRPDNIDVFFEGEKKVTRGGKNINSYSGVTFSIFQPGEASLVFCILARFSRKPNC